MAQGPGGVIYVTANSASGSKYYDLTAPDITKDPKYGPVFGKTAKQMFEARQSRTVGHLSGQQQRKLMSSAAGVLLSKSVDLSEEIYMAMISRGFRGEIYLLSEPRLRSVDYLAMAGFLAVSLSAVWLGR